MKKNGGVVKFTSGNQFSSTKIINDNFEDYKIIPKFLKQNEIKFFDKEKIVKEFQIFEKKIKKENFDNR